MSNENQASLDRQQIPAATGQAAGINMSRQQAMHNSIMAQRSVIGQMDEFLMEVKGEGQGQGAPNEKEQIDPPCMFASLTDMLNNTTNEIHVNTERMATFLGELKQVLL